MGPEALRTGEERWPRKGKEEANGSAAQSVRSGHLLDAVAWRALSHLLQPVPRQGCKWLNLAPAALVFSTYNI